MSAIAPSHAGAVADVPSRCCPRQLWPDAPCRGARNVPSRLACCHCARIRGAERLSSWMMRLLTSRWRVNTYGVEQNRSLEEGLAGSTSEGCVGRRRGCRERCCWWWKGAEELVGAPMQVMMMLIKHGRAAGSWRQFRGTDAAHAASLWAWVCVSVRRRIRVACAAGQLLSWLSTARRSSDFGWLAGAPRSFAAQAHERDAGAG